MYKIKTILGTEACNEFCDKAEFGEEIDTQLIKQKGFIQEREFDTEAELRAYLRGLIDADGTLKTLSLEPPDQGIFDTEPMNKYYDKL